MVAPNQLEHEQDSSCPPLLSDTRPYWPRKHDVQGTFKTNSLHETTTWTSCSCDIEIISKRWSEPELGKLLRWPCRDSSGFLNLHGNSTVFSERWLGGLWSIDLLNFAWFIVLVSKNWHKLHKHTFLLLTDSDQSDTDSLANDHFKNIWHVVKWRVPLVDELDWTWKVSMQNKHGLIFAAQSKLIYWKTLTFHAFGQMCLSEVLCLMMLKLGGPWPKSQPLTQLQTVSEAHAACTFLWDQQHSLLSNVTWRPAKASIYWISLDLL